MAILTPKELKLLSLALDTAASDGEIRNAAERFIRSLRQRNVAVADFVLPAVRKVPPKRNPGAVIMPFGKFKGQPIRTLPDWYLAWVVRTVTNQPELVKCINEFVTAQEEVNA